jgi:hypothetical protein
MSLYNLVAFETVCPRCGEYCTATAEFRLGLLQMRTYRLGEALLFDGVGEVVDKPGTTVSAEGYAECGCCHKDYWVTIRVDDDVIVSVTVDPARKPYIPDDLRTADGKVMHWTEDAGWVNETHQ